MTTTTKRRRLVGLMLGLGMAAAHLSTAQAQDPAATLRVRHAQVDPGLVAAPRAGSILSPANPQTLPATPAATQLPAMASPPGTFGKPADFPQSPVPATPAPIHAAQRAGGVAPYANSFVPTAAPARAATSPPAGNATAGVQQISYQTPAPGATEAPPAPESYRPDATPPEPVLPAPNGAAAPPPLGSAGPTCDPTSDAYGTAGADDCPKFCESYFYRNGWFAGAEYKYLRPNFDSPAASEQTISVDPNTNLTTVTNRLVMFDSEYESTYRLFGGYRWGDCGESLTVSYWRVSSADEFVSDPVPIDESVVFTGFLDGTADDPGEVLRADSRIDLDVWDLAYGKRVPTQTAAAGGCDPCCPLWDFGWSIGARIVDFEREGNVVVTNAAGGLLSSAIAEADFVGAGPRAGLEARRYFGDRAKWSMYGSGHLALLLGEHETRRTRFSGAVASVQVADVTRTVPVTDLEVGISRRFGCRTLLTAGYEFQAWWNMAHFESLTAQVCPCPPGDAHLLALDGLFVRLEHTFGGPRRACCP